ncbi:MAG TPA: V-type ATP synthase subunit F [Clostridiaceae bacterium]|nr:V-type ATP synthase subunit F [Clostridiaceae bacterium]
MHKVGVIGDLDSIIGFRALGMAVQPASDPETVLSTLKVMIDEEYAIVFITEPAADNIEVRKFLEERRNYLIPSVILIPSAVKKTNIGKEQLRNSVLKATGIDLLADL